MSMFATEMGEKYNGKLKPQEGSNTFLSCLTKEQAHRQLVRVSTLKVYLAVVVSLPAGWVPVDRQRETPVRPCGEPFHRREKTLSLPTRAKRVSGFSCGRLSKRGTQAQSILLYSIF